MRDKIANAISRHNESETDWDEMLDELCDLHNVSKCGDVSEKEVYCNNNYSSIGFVGVRKVEESKVHFSILKDNGDLSNTISVWDKEEFKNTHRIEPTMYLNSVC